MPVSFTSKAGGGALSGPAPAITAVDDDALDLIAGGQQFVFRGDGFQRDSWFVTFMTKRLIQDSVRQELALSATPQELLIEGRRYRVWQIGDTVYVEEAV